MKGVDPMGPHAYIEDQLVEQPAGGLLAVLEHVTGESA